MNYGSHLEFNQKRGDPERIVVIPWAVAHQVPLSMGFPRQEYWSGLPFPPPGDLPNPGIESTSLTLAGRFFTIEQPGKPRCEVRRGESLRKRNGKESGLRKHAVNKDGWVEKELQDG